MKLPTYNMQNLKADNYEVEHQRHKEEHLSE